MASDTHPCNKCGGPGVFRTMDVTKLNDNTSDSNGSNPKPQKETGSGPIIKRVVFIHVDGPCAFGT